MSSWLSSRWLATLAVLALSTVVLAVANLILQRPKLPANAPKFIQGWPIFGSIDFYLKRHEFLIRERKKHGGQSFSFYYGQFPIVSLVGEASRNFLYNSRQFDLRAGYSHCKQVICSYRQKLTKISQIFYFACGQPQRRLQH